VHGVAWALPGCGAVSGLPAIAPGTQDEKVDAAACATWARSLLQGVGIYDPAAAVLMVGDDEFRTRTLDGRTVRTGTAALERMVRDGLEDARTALAKRGATVVLMPAPCSALDPGAASTTAAGETRWIRAVWARYLRDHPDVHVVQPAPEACRGGLTWPALASDLAAASPG
jgi:hypothetical protein